MKTARLALFRVFLRFLPETSFFGLKRTLLRWCGAKVGTGVRICSSVQILGAGELELGDGTWVGHDAMLICSSRIRIGRNVDIAPRVFIGTGTHKIDFDGDRCAGEGISQDIEVGDGCWLCTHCIILPGVSIGPMTVVGAAALVNKNLPSRVVAYGIPARSRG